MKKWLIATAVAALMFLALPASASTVTTWSGNGSDNLPCETGAHWVLSPAQGITSAVLTVDGVTYDMIQNGEGSFAVDTQGALDAETTASAAYEGENESAFLKLSHCTEGETPSPTPTPTPTVTPSESPSPTPTDTPTETPSTSTHTTSPPQTTSTTSRPGPSPTAMTGIDGRTVAAGGIALGLLGLGVYSLYLARRKFTD